MVNAFDIKTLEKTIKEEVARDAVSAIIAQAPCVLLKTNVFKQSADRFQRNVKMRTLFKTGMSGPHKE